ncbi:unnamed protein product, partial [Ixodes pacificus]
CLPCSFDGAATGRRVVAAMRTPHGAPRTMRRRTRADPRPGTSRRERAAGATPGGTPRASPVWRGRPASKGKATRIPPTNTQTREPGGTPCIKTVTRATGTKHRRRPTAATGTTRKRTPTTRTTNNNGPTGRPPRSSRTPRRSAGC